MNLEQKLSNLICDTADIVYNKYQLEAYYLEGCQDPYDVTRVERNKLLIDLYQYLLCGGEDQIKCKLDKI